MFSNSQIARGSYNSTWYRKIKGLVWGAFGHKFYDILKKIRNPFIRHTRHALPRISVHIALFWKPSEVLNYPASSQFFSDRIVCHDQKPPSTYFRGKQKHFCAKNFQDFFARAPKFPKIFRAQNLEKLTRPENFGAPHGRPTTRDEILRRDPKF